MFQPPPRETRSSPLPLVSTASGLLATGVARPGREAVYAGLLAASRGRANDIYLARLLVSHTTGAGALSRWLGLGEAAFGEMMACCFPGVALPVEPPLRPTAPPARAEERAELRALMLSQRTGRDRAEVWIAAIVATACMAPDHLWHDLGLWSRADLTALMCHNFPRLAARNDRGMKWKRFLYKQLCEQEGIYTCRAPSCDVCADFELCFGPQG